MMLDAKQRHYQDIFRLTPGDENSRVRSVLREYATPNVKLTNPMTWVSNRTWSRVILEALNSTHDLPTLVIAISNAFADKRMRIKNSGDFAAALFALETSQKLHIERVGTKPFMTYRQSENSVATTTNAIQYHETDFGDQHVKFELVIQKLFQEIDKCTLKRYMALKCEVIAAGFKMSDVVMVLRGGESLLHRAICQNAGEKRTSFEDYLVIEALLQEAGRANLELKDSQENTPFLKALLLGRADLVDVLRGYGANINATTRHGISGSRIMQSPRSTSLLRERSLESVSTIEF